MSEHNEKDEMNEAPEQQEEAGLEFPINQALLDSATHAKEEWKVMRDRLAKIEEHKSQVAREVYERVRGDYKTRMKAVTEAVMQKKSEVDVELGTLRETRDKIAEDLKLHQHNLEEIKFRRTLGEFSEEEYQTAAREEQEKISKFETILSAVNSNIHRYEALFEDEPGLFAEEQPAPEAEEAPEVSEVSGVTPAPHEAEPVTDESGYVIEDTGPSYFSATAADDTNPMLETSGTTSKNIEVEEAGEPMRSRIVIINGDNAGATYPLKGTVSLGRAESNTVTIKDAKVSRQHAQIQQQGKEYIVVDLNSSNGTFVNDERIEEHVLSDGDEIRIGDCIMQFQQ